MARATVYGLGTVATACSLRSLGYLESDKSEGPADAQPEAQTDGQPDAQPDATPDAGAQPAYVQTCSAFSAGCPAACSGVATVACTFTQGNVLAVLAEWFSTNPLSAIHAPCVAGGFTLLHNPTPGIGGTPAAAALAYGVVTSSGPCTVTVAASSPTELVVVMDELTHVNTVSPLDGDQSTLAATGYITTGIALNSGTLTTTRAGDYIFVAVADDADHSKYDVGNGFSLVANVPLIGVGAATESQVQAAAGEVAGTFYSSRTGYFLIGAMAFQAR
jgi:hypothetical protein